MEHITTTYNVQTGLTEIKTRILTEEEILQKQENQRQYDIDKKLSELLSWFNTYFRMQLEQHLWQKDYKPSEDPYFKDENGQPKTYLTFEELTEQAEFVRDEIKRFRKEA